METMDVQREFRRHRVGKLAAARNRPTSVAPSDPISAAATLMMQHDYSQLPVMQGERTLKGLVSWRSVGRKHMLGVPVETVSDAMERVDEVSPADSLFDVIPIIARHDCVLVRDERNTIAGIVTAFDVSMELQRFGEPYWRLEDLESFLRCLIEKRFGPNEFGSLARVTRGSAPPASVDQLTFGEYVELLGPPEGWARLNVRLDRATFIEGLQRANAIRNCLMHFRDDDLGDADREFLVKFSRFVGHVARNAPKN